MSKRKRREQQQRVVEANQYLAQLRRFSKPMAQTHGDIDRERARLNRLVVEREERLEREREDQSTPRFGVEYLRRQAEQPKPRIRVQAPPYQSVLPPRYDRRLYFAYGSNLLDAQMRHRCPGATKLYRHELQGFKLEFQRHANIVKASEEDSVMGFMWLIHPEDEKWLDKFEGVASGSYEKKTFKFLTPKGNWRDVLYYQKPPGRLIQPTQQYLDKISKGYEAHGFSLDPLRAAVKESIAATRAWRKQMREMPSDELPEPSEEDQIMASGLDKYSAQELRQLLTDPTLNFTAKQRLRIWDVIWYLDHNDLTQE